MLCPAPSTPLREQVAVLQEGDIILSPGPGWGPEKGQASWPLGASSHGAGGAGKGPSWTRLMHPHPSPQMHCCGVTDYRDWFSVLGENTVPDRCCMENSQGCGQNNTTPVWKTVRLGTPGAPGWTVWAGAGVAQDTKEVA